MIAFDTGLSPEPGMIADQLRLHTNTSVLSYETAT